MLNFTDGQAYQMQLSEYIKMLKFQIFAYEQAVALDHTSLIEFNLTAICTEADYIKMCVNAMDGDEKIIDEHWQRELEKKRPKNKEVNNDKQRSA